MVPGGPSGVSDGGDLLPLLDRLPLPGKVFIVVGVDSNQSFVMLDNNYVAVAGRAPTGENYFPPRNGEYIRSLGRSKVDPVMFFRAPNAKF
jgi:hypothetical protein